MCGIKPSNEVVFQNDKVNVVRSSYLCDLHIEGTIEALTQFIQRP